MKTIFTSIIVMLSVIVVSAQPHGKQHGMQTRKDIQAAKIAFFTNALDLSVEEAQVFWPVYNELDKKQNENFEKQKNLYQDYNQNAEKYNDKQLEAIGDQLILLLSEREKLMIEYHSKFKKVLPPAKVIALYRAEIQFKNKLLNQIGKKGQKGIQNE